MHLRSFICYQRESSRSPSILPYDNCIYIYMPYTAPANQRYFSAVAIMHMKQHIGLAAPSNCLIFVYPCMFLNWWMPVRNVCCPVSQINANLLHGFRSFKCLSALSVIGLPIYVVWTVNSCVSSPTPILGIRQATWVPVNSC